MTTVGWQGKQNLLATTVVLLNWLLPTAEQKPLFIASLGRDCIEHSGIDV